jgi:Spy/CpxP family protein refolding chaperone
MKKLTLVGGLLAIFSSGVLVGISGTTIYQKHLMSNIFRGGPQARSERILKMYLDELDLTEDQRPGITSIFYQTEKDIITLMEEGKPKIDEIINRRHAMMKPLLTPEQQKKLEAIHQQTTHPPDAERPAAL